MLYMPLVRVAICRENHENLWFLEDNFDLKDFSILSVSEYDMQIRKDKP